MKRSNSIKLIAGVAAVPVIALVAAGCGGGYGDGSAAVSAPPKTAPGQAATLGTASEGKPTADGGADASLIGTTTRSDGKPQVTYNGHPLYLYSGDQAAGEANGQGSTAFGGGWFALTAAGDQVSGQASSSSGGVDDTGDSGYGGGYGGGY